MARRAGGDQASPHLDLPAPQALQQVLRRTVREREARRLRASILGESFRAPASGRCGLAWSPPARAPSWPPAAAGRAGAGRVPDRSDAVRARVRAPAGRGCFRAAGRAGAPVDPAPAGWLGPRATHRVNNALDATARGQRRCGRAWAPNLDMLATPAAIRQRSPATSNQMVWRGGNSRRIPRHRNSDGARSHTPGEIAVCCSRTGRQSRRSLLIVSTEAEAPQPAADRASCDRGADRARLRHGSAGEGGEGGLAFLIAFACALFAAFAQSARVDARSSTLAEAGAGRPAHLDERAGHRGRDPQRRAALPGDAGGVRSSGGAALPAPRRALGRRAGLVPARPREGAGRPSRGRGSPAPRRHRQPARRIHGAAADLAAGGVPRCSRPAIWARCSPRSGTRSRAPRSSWPARSISFRSGPR